MINNTIIISIMLLILAKCGHPELLPMTSNDTVPTVEGQNDLPIEGSTVIFSCPPGLVLIGPNSATCTESGEWEPDFSSLMCNNSKGYSHSCSKH